MPNEWPDLTALELLVAVADHGSLGAAARSIGMAQPNATRSLARLERQLRCELVVRGPRGSALTPAGQLVTEQARRTLAAARDVLATATSLSGATRTTLRISASQTIADHLLPVWLGGFRASHPDTGVVVRVGNSTDVINDVRSARSGLGFVERPDLPRGLHRQQVAHDEMVLVVAPHHVWAGRRRPVTLLELARTPLITREPGSGTRTALDEALDSPIQPYLEVASNAAVRVSVASGAAPAVLSRLAVADAIAAGTLVAVPLASRIRRPLHAVWNGPRRLGGPAADLVMLAAAVSERG